MEQAENKEIQKKPVSRKVFSIILLCVASLVVVGMILCYFIPKNYAPAFNQPESVKVYTKTDSAGRVYHNDSEVYNKVMELCTDSFKVTIMDALLKGKLSDGGDYDTHSSGTKSNPKSLGDYKIELCYDSEQTITDKAYEGEFKTYLSILIVVKNTTELSVVDVYYMFNTSTSRVSFETYAHQSALYDYLANL